MGAMPERSKPMLALIDDLGHIMLKVTGYVMMFAMTLGTYSIIPSIYLWREVSKRLAVSLFVFFLVLGWVLGLVF